MEDSMKQTPKQQIKELKQNVETLQATVESLNNRATYFKNAYDTQIKAYDSAIKAQAAQREQAVIDACTKVAEVISGKRVKNFNIVFH